MTPVIRLFELGPTRSARCRWTLLEAGLPFESLGNTPDVIGRDDLRKLHPLGKLPAATIDGRPLFESAAISTAIADLAPERALIAAAGTYERALHDQWVSFALTELDAWAWCAELNSDDFLFPAEQHVAAILPQNQRLYRAAAEALSDALSEASYLVGDRFSVTDIIVGYSVRWGEEFGWIDGLTPLADYLDRLRARTHCTLTG